MFRLAGKRIFASAARGRVTQSSARLFSSSSTLNSQSSAAVRHWRQGAATAAVLALGVAAASATATVALADEASARNVPAACNTVTVLQSKAVDRLMTFIRNKDTNTADFAYYADRLMRLLAEESLAHMTSAHSEVVQTPCGPYDGWVTPSPESMCVVSIVRSGDILTDAVRAVSPGIAVGKVLVQRDESDPEKRPKLFYQKLPHDISKRHVLLCDPMLATGGSAKMVIDVLIKAGVREDMIVFSNVVSCPEGLMALQQAFPKIRVVTAAVDARLNEHKFIVPGLGDFGDRYYNTGD